MSLALDGAERALEEGEATVGDWVVNEFARFSPETGYVQLVQRSGRFLFLAEMANETEIFAGTQARGVLYSVANSFDRREEDVATLFHFAFFDDGVRRLRSTLRMKEAPLYEVALALADRVYLSGQYPAGPAWDRSNLQDLARKRVHPLVASEGRLRTLAPAEALKGAEAVEVTFGAPADGGAGVLFPGALSNDGREYLSVCLQNQDGEGRGRLMPLHPTLRESLWDFSGILAALPDDVRVN
jgi:hypothetical protein